MLLLMVVRSMRRWLTVAVAGDPMRLRWIVVMWLGALRVMRLWRSVRPHWHHWSRISSLFETLSQRFLAYCVEVVAVHTLVDQIGSDSCTSVVVLDVSFDASSLELLSLGLDIHSAVATAHCAKALG